MSNGNPFQEFDDLDSTINSRIDKSNEMEITWHVHKGVIRHTALVLKFDGNCRFTLDYGAEAAGKIGNVLSGLFSSSSQASSSSSSRYEGRLAVGSDIALNKFDVNANTDIMETLLAMSIRSLDCKTKAKRLILTVARIKMGKYNLLLNNCRDFVKRAAELLENESESSTTNWAKFYEKINAIKYEDVELMVEGALTVAKSIAETVKKE